MADEQLPADVHLLTGAYALGAVDDAERSSVEAHLAGCEGCREEVGSFLRTAARLAEGVAVTPPPALRGRVLAEVRRTPQLPPQRVPTHDAPGPAAPGQDDARGAVDELAARRGRRRARRARGPLVAAAAAVLVALAGTGFGVQQYLDARESQQVAAAQERRIVQIVADPAARRLSAPVSGGGTVTVVLAGSRAVVSATGLRALPADRTYQLWAVAPGGIRSLGLGAGSAEAAGPWARAVDGVRPGEQVALSVEPTGGSEQPTTTPVVAVQV